MEQEKIRNLQWGERAAIVSIFAYLALSSLKLWIGYASDSEALRADGYNNATDIAASIAVWIGLRLSQRPADRDHPYGHWRAETVASLVASFIMAAVGIKVVTEAIGAVWKGSGNAPDPIAAWTGIACAIAMYAVYRYNRRIGQTIDSQAVKAAAKDNLSDVWVSAGTVIGIVGALLGLPWLDPVTAIVVGLLICKTAWDIFRDASHHLTDGFDESQLQKYKDAVLSVQGVAGVKDIRARSYGSNKVVDIVLLVKPHLDLMDAHDISTQVEKELSEKHDVYAVHVHVEPKIPASAGK